jgi:hypothetical protein
MIDKAFLSFHEALLRFAAIGTELYNEDRSIHSYIYRFDIDSPVELDIVRDENGKLQIGSTPPLYDVATSIRPSIHSIRFTAELTDWKDEE